jgi:hypothetical protein
MSELLQRVLTDASARDHTTLPTLASGMAEKFLPWAEADGS